MKLNASLHARLSGHSDLRLQAPSVKRKVSQVAHPSLWRSMRVSLRNERVRRQFSLWGLQTERKEVHPGTGGGQCWGSSCHRRGPSLKCGTESVPLVVEVQGEENQTDGTHGGWELTVSSVVESACPEGSVEMSRQLPWHQESADLCAQAPTGGRGEGGQLRIPVLQQWYRKVSRGPGFQGCSRGWTDFFLWRDNKFDERPWGITEYYRRKGLWQHRHSQDAGAKSSSLKAKCSFLVPTDEAGHLNYCNNESEHFLSVYCVQTRNLSIHTHNLMGSISIPNWECERLELQGYTLQVVPLGFEP